MIIHLNIIEDSSKLKELSSILRNRNNSYFIKNCYKFCKNESPYHEFDVFLNFAIPSLRIGIIPAEHHHFSVIEKEAKNRNWIILTYNYRKLKINE